MRKSYYLLLIMMMMMVSAALAQPGQIAIPRVELMPNQPTPYNVRDWQEVALRYDSFVYDLQRAGQYLPLSYLIPAGLNYPEQGSFGLHTYVGTNSPLGNEAINVLPSLVGASLAGIDKRSQFGRDWVLMAQDFFNKANGENIYLNNPGASSGNDWWYDMMPNVFFYQLYDLYPGLGSEADWQFETIASRFLEAVRAMGGHDAPWAPAYMNYRAWRFQSMEPNASGVPEPEAAGAFAWALYHAWKKTGNPDFLKGAEWSIEFLDDWPANPSYELQLPYGTLTAAKMNAEIGTRYDVEKMVNWSFDRGPLRGWGTIVGNWNGFDVAGLVGEANDGGNDYAFQLNGVQQAAALVPMVRYDKRYARAIGKWVLNLANATRLFFPGFLPSSLQDASAWSSANDPGQVMGYEALRQVWQGASPFSTGDAVLGGWAATNLALYGTSSIGYLGALVEKTDVDRILKIDLLKTDFFRDEAYPSYLFYNSYNTARTIQFHAGDAPADLYEALSESFLLQNVDGSVSLSIPANEAILVVVCPAGGEVTYDRNKMLVDGVVVDYRQSAQPFSQPPRIKALAAADNPLEIGGATALYCTISAAGSGPFTYQWSSSAGTIEGEGESVGYTAPPEPSEAEIRCIVTDPEGLSDTAALHLTIVPEINYPPQIIALEQSAPYIAPGGVLQLECRAFDPNNGPLSYTWAASGGSISGSGSAVEWAAPLAEGIFQISVTVTDETGLTAAAAAAVLVNTFSPAAGDLIAYYPFSGNADDHSGNGLHGQAAGAILTADQFGNPQSAYYLNGGSQHINVPNHPLLNFQNAITISCWFSAAGLPEKETFLLSHGSWQNRWKLSITPERYLRWTINSLGGIRDLDALVPLRTDSFYHVAATYDGELLALYLGGELHSFRAFSGLMRTTSAPFLIGQMLPGEADFNFKGTIDEVKIYDHALVPEAVQALYAEGTSSTRALAAGPTPILKLFPNPARHQIIAALPGEAGPLEMLRVFDLYGRQVLEIDGRGREWAELDLRALPPGIYQAVGSNAKGRFAGRFVKI
jgi:hypothetical protein